MHDKLLTRALQKQLGGIQRTLEALIDRDEGISAAQFQDLLTHLSASFGKFKGDTGEPADPVQVAAELRKDTGFIASLKGERGQSIKGDSPKRGKDYFTKADILYFQNTLKSLVRAVEVNNKQTIEKGFNDAYKSILRLIQGKEKAYAKHKDVIKELTDIRQSIKDTVKAFAELSPAKIKEIARGIEKLEGNDRLDARKLKNLPKPSVHYVSGGTINTDGGTSSITITKQANDTLLPVQVGANVRLTLLAVPIHIIYVTRQGQVQDPSTFTVSTNQVTVLDADVGEAFIVCYTS